MRLTIVPSDNVVVVDGRALRVDLASFDQLAGVHAVQWNGDKGHLEFDNRERDETEFKLNERIVDIDVYRDIVEAWRSAAVEEDAALERAKEQAAKNV